jgi:hypothetical protein
VLSPDAVRSGSIALKEVAFAASLNKRLAPIVFRPVEEKALPDELAKLNFIFFDDAVRFEQSADQLAQALATDIGWVRQHTEFGEQARRWAAVDMPSGLLLRSPVLEQAERWIAGGPAMRRRRRRKHSVSSGAAGRRRHGAGMFSPAVSPLALSSPWSSPGSPTGSGGSRSNNA